MVDPHPPLQPLFVIAFEDPALHNIVIDSLQVVIVRDHGPNRFERRLDVDGETVVVRSPLEINGAFVNLARDRGGERMHGNRERAQRNAD